LDAFWKDVKEACEQRRNLKKPQFALPQQELRRTINERDKMLRERKKPSPLSDYEHSLNKSYKASQNAKRARKDVAQLGQQSLQSIDPLVVEDDCTNAQGDQSIWSNSISSWTQQVSHKNSSWGRRYQQPSALIYSRPISMA